MQNHFELFQLPLEFALDSKALDSAFQRVQSQVHPDKFVSASEAEKRVAMQWATRANEAYQTLKKPLSRARYLCELQGHDIASESNTAMPAAFLMQQMEWRERFDDIRSGKDWDAVADLEREVRSAWKQCFERIELALKQQNYSTASAEIRIAMFLEKFLADIAALED